MIPLMRPKRKLNRKYGYDYSQPGYYAVTICKNPTQWDMDEKNIDLEP